MSKVNCLIFFSGGYVELSPHPNGDPSKLGSPRTAIRENEFHFSYSAAGSSLPFTHTRRSTGMFLWAIIVLPATKKLKRSVNIALKVNSRRSPDSKEKKTQPILARSATSMTDVGPSVKLNAKMTIKQPRAAPARSAA